MLYIFEPGKTSLCDWTAKRFTFVKGLSFKYCREGVGGLSQSCGIC